jgi:nicotinate-nucleotide pyrophosphorylase
MGRAEAQVYVRDPLVLQTTVPRFLIEGDEAMVPALVTNLSGARRNVTVEISVEDLLGPAFRGDLERSSPVKDNHIAAAGGLAEALTRLKTKSGHLVRIEVEVDTLDQLAEALQFPIDAVLLDNMDIDTLRQAVKLVAGRAVTEASGGVTLDTVREIAKTGVDVISVGALTHSPRNLDSSLEWES